MIATDQRNDAEIVCEGMPTRLEDTPTGGVV